MLKATASAGELLERGLEWGAWNVHRAVAEFNDKAVREYIGDWTPSPCIHRNDKSFDLHCVLMGSSPRFDKYGSEFGMGKALALRSGYANKFDGKVSSYPGREGGGSVDLEVCLSPETMRALESDQGFMEAAGLIT